MLLSLVIFTIFTLLATAGAFWIGKAQHSLATGIALGLTTLLFMAGILGLLVFYVWPRLEGLQP